MLSSDKNGWTLFWRMSEVVSERPLGIYVTYYQVTALYWPDVNTIMLAEIGDRHPHFYTAVWVADAHFPLGVHRHVRGRGRTPAQVSVWSAGRAVVVDCRPLYPRFCENGCVRDLPFTLAFQVVGPTHGFAFFHGNHLQFSYRSSGSTAHLHDSRNQQAVGLCGIFRDSPR